jgi:hypothetical protein
MSAWTPSLPITVKLSEAFPEITFEHRYAEMSMDFSGVWVLRAGKLVDDKIGDYDEYPVYDEEEE